MLSQARGWAGGRRLSCGWSGAWRSGWLVGWLGEGLIGRLGQRVIGQEVELSGSWWVGQAGDRSVRGQLRGWVVSWLDGWLVSWVGGVPDGWFVG